MKHVKRTSESKVQNEAPAKKQKPNHKTSANDLKNKTVPKNKQAGKKAENDPAKKKQPVKKLEQKPEDWKEFKKKKKEVREKRKEGKKFYEVIVQAKKIAEQLRLKKIEGGAAKRDELVTELHGLIGNQGNYKSFVLAHDMARVVQYMLKFGSENIKKELANELIPSTVEIIQSKYARFCIKRLLKYGSPETRANCIKAMYGNAVKLSSHGVSAPVFEYAYSTWASPLDKINLIQEFFGDMYKQSKDANVKHVRDVYANSPDMKSAVLTATKANLGKILDKNLLNSGLAQSVMCQYLTECSAENRAELITQLAPHVVVISNSKDGVRAAMQIFWHGSNKDKKNAMKALKEHAIELCKHEHGHCGIITLLDSADDTVLLNKLILNDILSNAHDLVADDWGRKVLLWLVTPADQNHFHPLFIGELETGKKDSTCKKDAIVRRQEVLAHAQKSLLASLETEPKFWLEQPSRAVVALAILKTVANENALRAISEAIVDTEWTLKDGDAELIAIEHSGLHMALKKLAQHDKILSGPVTFGATLVELLTDEVLKCWLNTNRGCFLLLNLFENNREEVQEQFKVKLSPHKNFLRKQKMQGAKLLSTKIL